MTRYSDRLDDIEQQIAAQTSVAPLTPAIACDSDATRPAGAGLALRPPAVLQRPAISTRVTGSLPVSNLGVQFM
jgi:hypothetical protein